MYFFIKKIKGISNRAFNTQKLIKKPLWLVEIESPKMYQMSWGFCF